jgi:hypothetical protein
VADALSYAHGHDVVHRDIKPGNVLLEAGHAVVADFGIARAITAASGEQLTETGIALGTPAYMSPEQAAGSTALDGRSDLYSLGCVLYEMLAGQPPFVGPTVESVVHQHLTVEPHPITSLRPAVPAAVAAALSRALAKTPADRFHRRPCSGGAWPAGVSGGRRCHPARSYRWQAQVAAAACPGSHLVVIAGAVALGRWLRPGGSGSRYPPTAIAVLPFRNLSAVGPHAYFAGGLHDELVTQLAKVAALAVMGRTSVMTYAGTTKSPPQIARTGVGTIVRECRSRTVGVMSAPGCGHRITLGGHYDRTLDVRSPCGGYCAANRNGRWSTLTGAGLSHCCAAEPSVPVVSAGEEYRQRPDALRQELECRAAERRCCWTRHLHLPMRHSQMSMGAVLVRYDPYRAG